MLSTIITAALAALITTTAAGPPPPSGDGLACWTHKGKYKCKWVTAPDCSPCLYGCGPGPEGPVCKRPEWLPPDAPITADVSSGMAEAAPWPTPHGCSVKKGKLVCRPIDSTPCSPCIYGCTSDGACKRPEWLPEDAPITWPSA